MVASGAKWYKEGEMFRGRSSHTLDAKGRLSIPSRFKDVLRSRYNSDLLVITTLPTCLAAYPMDEWRKLEENFGRFDLVSPPEVLSFQRYFLAGGIECPVDGQGRTLLPIHLREEAGIDREVVLCGMLKYFEIWSKPALDEELKKARNNFEQHTRLISPITSK